jgi:16S rRNA (uracil1498-N3)-methyltransferase
LRVTARFHAPDARAEGDLVALPNDEAGHLTRVLRLTTGASVVIFNGQGLEFDAVVEQARRSSVVVRLGSSRVPSPEAGVAVTLAQAVLKGDKMDDVIRDAVMMGVAAILPVVTTRTEVTISALNRGRRQERWQRIAVASAKQCGRAVVPVVHAPTDVAGLLQQEWPMRLMLVEPSAGVATQPITDLSTHPSNAVLIVGPEGGWTADELSRSAATCQFVSIGPRTLRADAVPLVALTALFTVWRQLV